MLLQIAIVLGDTLKKCDPEHFLTADGSSGCAIGGALLAVSKAILAEAGNLKRAQEVWPWLTSDQIDEIGAQYFALKDGRTTIDQIADYVRSIEPPETESTPAERAAEHTEREIGPCYGGGEETADDPEWTDGQTAIERSHNQHGNGERFR